MIDDIEELTLVIRGKDYGNLSKELREQLLHTEIGMTTPAPTLEPWKLELERRQNDMAQRFFSQIEVEDVAFAILMGIEAEEQQSKKKRTANPDCPPYDPKMGF